MRGYLMPARRTPGQGYECNDEHGVEADDIRVKVEGAWRFAVHPECIEAGDAEPQRGQRKQPPVPAVNSDGARPYLWNELNRSPEGNDRGQQCVRCEDQIPSPIAGD